MWEFCGNGAHCVFSCWVALRRCCFRGLRVAACCCLLPLAGRCWLFLFAAPVGCQGAVSESFAWRLAVVCSRLLVVAGCYYLRRVLAVRVSCVVVCSLLLFVASLSCRLLFAAWCGCSLLCCWLALFKGWLLLAAAWPFGVAPWVGNLCFGQPATTSWSVRGPSFYLLIRPDLLMISPPQTLTP